MARSSYKTEAIVLRKTKLGETDLILTLLACDGSQLRAVAKGARKPSNTFAARLELYSVAEILCSEGKNLDIIKEARLMQGNIKLRSSIEYSTGAAPMAELLDKVTQKGLCDERLFQMTKRAFFVLDHAEISSIPALCAAHLLKTLAFCGLRPSFSHCVCCGNETTDNSSGEYVRISYLEGGLVCNNCASQLDTIVFDSAILSWAHYLLKTSFSDIEEKSVDINLAFEILHFCQSWIKEHIGSQLKSLHFVFNSGLYE